MRSHRLAFSCLGAAFLAALVALSSLALHEGSAGAAGPGRCVEAVRVIAVRGSGEPDYGGPGKTVGTFVKQLEAQADPGAVNGEGLGYPAVSVIPSKPALAFGILAGPGGKAIVVGHKAAEYRRSVEAGVANLVDVVKARVKHCSGVKLVLSGYSQGAQVVREALPKLSSLAAHIGGVVLFGDPGFDPHSRAAEGTFSKRRHGILGLPDHDFPAAFGHLVSYCRGGDMICQGLPNTTTAHKHYPPQMTEEGARKVADWLGLRRTRSCAPAKNIAAILDDSGSMEENDPLNIRSAAMQLLITEPGGQDRTLGAVEFGDEAGPLFNPAPISQGEATMLSSLQYLADDGYAGTGSDTNYNAAFAAAAAAQPSADARIFLTDGQHNVGPYEDGHRGGPRTYVVGLNIGPSGQGDEAADLLGRIASETGGAYYPLRLKSDDDATVQTGRLQPVFNSIDAKLECQIAPSQAVRTLTKVGAAAKPVGGSYLGNPGVQVVVSWTTPGAEVDVSGAAVRNPNGGLVANLTGIAPKRHHHKGRKIETLQTSTVAGQTFRTVTIDRPKHGSTISVRVSAKQLSEPTVVTVQLSPVESLPTQPPANTTIPAAPNSNPSSPAGTPSSPAPPQTVWYEQVTPNHPVNTFTTYHNASGVGPQIPAGQVVQVSCRVYDPTIGTVNPDGYWYRIASPPWNNAYYAAANVFLNGDPPGGPYTHNTDFSVPVC
jgi:hypothetical protein